MTAIDQLSDDVLLEIFLTYQEMTKRQEVRIYQLNWREYYAWVDGLTRVCKRWRTLAINSALLWTDISLTGVRPDVVSLFLQRSREAPLNILTKNPNVMTIPVKHPSRMLGWAAGVVSICTGKTSSSRIPISPISFTLDSVLAHAHRIRSIDVFVPQSSAGAHAVAFAKPGRLQFPQLTSLRLIRFDPLGIGEYFIPAFLDIADNFPQLCSLDVMGFRWLQAKKLLSRNLNELSIKIASVVECADFLDVLEGLPLLEILNAYCTISLGPWAARFATSPRDLSPHRFRPPGLLPRLRSFYLVSGALTMSVILDHLTLSSIHHLKVIPSTCTRNAELLSSAGDILLLDSSSTYSTDELCFVIASGLRPLLREEDQLPHVNRLIVHLQSSGGLDDIRVFVSSLSSPPSLNTNIQCQESQPHLMATLGHHETSTLPMLGLLPVVMPLESLQSLTIGTAIPEEKSVEGVEIVNLLFSLRLHISLRSLSFARAAADILPGFLNPATFEKPLLTFPGLQELTITWEEISLCRENDWREGKWVSKLTEALERRSDVGSRLELLCLLVRQPVSSVENLDVTMRLRDCVTKLKLSE